VLVVTDKNVQLGLESLFRILMLLKNDMTARYHSIQQTIRISISSTSEAVHFKIMFVSKTNIECYCYVTGHTVGLLLPHSSTIKHHTRSMQQSPTGVKHGWVQ
jgi:hypothetical protein